MKRPKLKPYLLDYINSQESYIKKVDLYLIGDRIEHSAESTARALRKLAETEQIKVSYYDGKWAKGLAKYGRLSEQEPKTPQLQELIKPDGTRVMVMT